jgi:hypothetical protein
MQADFGSQLEQALDNIEALLASAGMGKADVVKTTFFLTRAADVAALGEASPLGIRHASCGDGPRSLNPMLWWKSKSLVLANEPERKLSIVRYE